MSEETGTASPYAGASGEAPSEIRLSKDRRTLTVAFGDERHAIPAELLRVESPSAEVQGHAPSQKVTVPGKRHVEIIGIEPVGNYAVRITFGDLHATGIYPWPLLRRMGREGAVMMEAYERALAEQGLSRDPPARG